MTTPVPDSSFNLKVVTQMTGLNEHTLRAWENRYEAVTPARTPGGHRVYSRVDVDRLRLLARLVENGHAIGGIAGLTDEQLAKRLRYVDRLADDGPAEAPAGDGSETFVRDVKKALRRFDLDRVQETLQVARFQFGARIFALGVVAILMAEVGELVASRTMSVAHEHALSAVVKSHLLELMFAGSRQRASRKIGLATPEGDLHEIGLLIGGVLCAHHGFGVAYIGPNMPADALGEALKALKTDVAIVAATDMPFGLHPSRLASFLKRAAKPLPRHHQIWLGGLPGRDVPLSGMTRPWRHLRSFMELDQALKEYS